MRPKLYLSIGQSALSFQTSWHGNLSGFIWQSCSTTREKTFLDLAVSKRRDLPWDGRHWVLLHRNLLRCTTHVYQHAAKASFADFGHYVGKVGVPHPHTAILGRVGLPYYSHTTTNELSMLIGRNTTFSNPRPHHIYTQSSICITATLIAHTSLKELRS